MASPPAAAACQPPFTVVLVSLSAELSEVECQLRHDGHGDSGSLAVQ